MVSPATNALMAPDSVTEFRPTVLTLSPAVKLGWVVSTTISPTCTPALEVKVMLDEFWVEFWVAAAVVVVLLVCVNTRLSKVKPLTDLESVMLLPLTAKTVSVNKLLLLVLDVKSVIRSPT